VTQFLPLAPVLLAAVAMFGLFDQATLSLLPAYGLSHGLSVAVSAAALGVLNVGNVVLQVPIGWLADRLPRRHVLAGCAAATVAGCAALPVAVTTPWLLWPLLFVWGGRGLRRHHRGRGGTRRPLLGRDTARRERRPSR
jgi:MFS family permease